MSTRHFTWFISLWLLCLMATAQQSEWDRSLRKTMEEGRDLFSQDLFVAASEKFDFVLRQNPDKNTDIQTEAHYFKALCAIFLMNEDGELLMSQFIADHPTSPLAARGIFQAGDYFFNRKSYRQTIYWFEKLDPRDVAKSDRGRYHFRLGYSYLMTKKEEEAQLQFAKIKDDKSSENAAAAKYYYAHIAYGQDQTATALKNFTELIDDPQFGPVVPYYLVQIQYRSENYTEVIATGETLLKNDAVKRRPEISRLVGEAYFKKRNYFEALPYLELYAEEGGRMTHADYYQLGFARYSTNNYEGAMEAFNRITSGKTALAQNAYYHLGDCYIKTNRPNKAATAFRAAAQMDFDEALREEAAFNYAKLNYELANPYENGIVALQDFVQTYPASKHIKEANRLLANLYVNTKDYTNALIAISNTGLQTAEMKEAYQKVSYFRGVEHYQNGQINDAVNLFEQALQYPYNQTYVALSKFWIAESLFRLNQFEAALKQYEDFQVTNGAMSLSEYVSMHYGRAYAYFKLEDYDRAATSFKRYADHKKARPRMKADARLRLADCLFLLGRHEPAAEAYRQYLTTNNPDMDYARFQRSLTLGLLGKTDDKIRELQLLISSGNSKFIQDAQYELAETYMKKESYGLALSAFQDFINRYPKASQIRRAELNMGVIYRNTNEQRKSVETLKGVVQKYPSTPEALEAISYARLVYADMNQIEEYVTWVETLSFVNIEEASLDSTMYITAFDLYSMDQCEGAIKGFKDYLKRFSKGMFVLQSQYYTAECAYRLEQDEVALKAYTAVTEMSINEFTERSLNRAAELELLFKNYEKALVHYRSLQQIASTEGNIRDSRIGIFRAALELGLQAEQLEMAKLLITDDRLPPALAGRARLIIARDFMAKNDLENAKRAFKEIDAKDAGAPKAEANYFIAKIQNSQQQYELSSQTIYGLIDNFPGQQEWRYKALLILADNFYKLDDSFQALYTLDFIIDDNYNQEIVKKAQEMKVAIETAQEQQQQKREQINQLQLNERGLQKGTTDQEDNTTDDEQ
jgi:TolA-binding protein